MIIWLVGMSGAGKTTIGQELYKKWKSLSKNTVFIDGDEVRHIFRHEDEEAYTIKGRKINSERISALCSWLDQQDINVVCSMLSLFEEHREQNRNTLSSYFEVFIDVPLDELIARDSKGLYKLAREGKMKNVVGFDIPFDPPKNPDVVIHNGNPPVNIEGAVTEILTKSGVLQ